MTNPPTVKIAPIMVKTRTKTAPVRTLDLSEEFIMMAPTTMIMPLMIPTAPTTATAAPIIPMGATLERDPMKEAAEAMTIPTRR